MYIPYAQKLGLVQLTRFSSQGSGIYVYIPYVEKRK
jgi:xanthine/uracil permease